MHGPWQCTFLNRIQKHLRCTFLHVFARFCTFLHVFLINKYLRCTFLMNEYLRCTFLHVFAHFLHVFYYIPLKRDLTLILRKYNSPHYDFSTFLFTQNCSRALSSTASSCTDLEDEDEYLIYTIHLLSNNTNLPMHGFLKILHSIK